MKHAIFYHSADPDGWCSGAIIYHHLTDSGVSPGDIHGLPIDYGDPIPWDYIRGSNVWILDFSFDPADMERFIKISNHVIWIDHHKTAIEKLKAYKDVKGLRRVGLAGCELAWEHLYKGPSPKAVHLIGRYDVWDWQNRPGCLEFSTGIRLPMFNAPNIQSPLWDGLLNYPERAQPFITEIINAGTIALEYRNFIWKKLGNQRLFQTGLTVNDTFYSCVAVNTSHVNSLFFDQAPQFKNTHFGLVFSYLPGGKHPCPEGRWLISLYKARYHPKAIDVGEIAASFGGGGHKRAAGFKCQQLPFDLK